MNLVSLYDDIIKYMINYCDEFSIYFLMQTCRRFARIINYYDINILGIRQYSITSKNNNINRWFSDAQMTINNKNILNACINLAINNGIPLFNKLITRANHDFSGSYMVTAIKHHRDKILTVLLTNFGIPNLLLAKRLITTAMTVNNAPALSIILDLYQPKFLKRLLSDKIVGIATDNLSFDILDTLKHRSAIKCICHLTNEDLKIASWCASHDKAIEHPNMKVLFDAIGNCDASKFEDYTLGLIKQFGDAITFAINKISARYIKNNDIERLKITFRFNIDCDMISDAAIGCDNMEILKYLRANDKLDTRSIMRSAIKRDNIEILRWIYDIDPNAMSRSVNIAISYGKLDIFEWINNTFPGKYHTNNLCHIASIHNDISTLKYLRQHGYEWNHKIINAALINNNWRMLKWAINNGCPRSVINNMKYEAVAAKFGPRFCI